MRRFIPLTIFLVIVAGLFTAAWYWGDGDRDWGRDHDTAQVVRVVDNQGQPVGDGNTVIIDRDRGPFFFPFGFFLIPLFIFLLFWTFGRRGGRPYGPNGYPTDTPPQWFEHWYEQMRRREQNRTTPPQDE